MKGSAGRPSASESSALQGAIAGEVILHDSRDYESARKPAIGRFEQIRPEAVVRCETPGDVAETISFAQMMGLPTATRSGGHCFAGRSSCEGIVIDLSPMNAVALSRGVATVGAGARLGHVYDSLIEHDLTIPAGSCHSVGIAGLTLGGGLGILGRKYGLTSDHLLGAQVFSQTVASSSATTTTSTSCFGRSAAPVPATSAWSPRSSCALGPRRLRRTFTWLGRTPARPR
jgi:FAD/FMN-containing dehydrogenase